MSLRWILGPAGSGKTHHCLERLREAETAGRRAVFLVPEQFTYAADREIVSGLPGLRHVDVLSFSRLAAGLRERAGTPKSLAMDEATRPMLLRRVLRSLSPEELGPFAAQRSRVGFLRELSRCVAEVRRHGVTRFIEAIERGADDFDDQALAQKLRAIAHTYSAYRTRLREIARRDPEEELADAPARIDAESARWRELPVYVDGFVSWTRQERDVLLSLARAGAALELTLCLDPDDAVRPCFQVPAASRRQFESEAAAARLPFDVPVVLSPRTGGIERALFGPARSAPPPGGPRVAFQEAREPREEVVGWARAIDERLRLSRPALRPRQVAVVLRDVEPYRAAIERTFARYGIPYFLDDRRGVLAEPRARFLIDAFDVLLSGWRRDAVITWLRNPLLRLEPAMVDVLEYLSLEHARDYDAWWARSWGTARPAARQKPLPRAALEAEREAADASDPESFDADDPDAALADLPAIDDREDADDSTPGEATEDWRVSIVDAVRARVAGRLRAFEAEWPLEGLAATEVVRAVRSLLADLAPPAEDAWDRQVEDAIERLVDEAAALWGDLPVTVDEFLRTLREGLASLRLGRTPQGLDPVVIADVQRSRLEGIRFAIVGGVNEDCFPRPVADGPILADRERRALNDLGVPLGPSAAEKQSEEAYLFYIAATRGSEEVLFTWSTASATGAAMKPSIFAGEARRASADAAVWRPAPIDAQPVEDLQTSLELVDRILARGEPTPSAVPLRVSELVDLAGSSLEHLATEVLDDALGIRFAPEPLVTSVSRLQQYARCPYQAFAARVLRLEPRPEPEVTPLAIGSLVHATLDRLLRTTALLPTDLAELSARLDETLRQVARDPEFAAFGADISSAYRLTQVSRALAQFVRVEAARLAASQFRPHRTELRFGGSLDAGLVVPVSPGRSLALGGSIDRVDTRVEGERVEALVIDYKLSPRTGARRDLEEGLDLQLASYLLYLQSNEGFEPVGGLYVPTVTRHGSEEALGFDSSSPSVQANGFFLAAARDAVDAGSGLLVGLRGKSQALGSSDELRDLLTIARDHLRLYAAAWQRGWVGARPLRRKGKLECLTCDYQAVCRFRPGVDPPRDRPTEAMEPPPPLPEVAE